MNSKGPTSCSRRSKNSRTNSRNSTRQCPIPSSSRGTARRLPGGIGPVEGDRRAVARATGRVGRTRISPLNRLSPRSARDLPTIEPGCEFVFERPGRLGFEGLVNMRDLCGSRSSTEVTPAWAITHDRARSTSDRPVWAASVVQPTQCRPSGVVEVDRLVPGDHVKACSRRECPGPGDTCRSGIRPPAGL